MHACARSYARTRVRTSQAQFALLSSTPEREARFQSLRKACEMVNGRGKGSTWAWHGSGQSRTHAREAGHAAMTLWGVSVK